MNTDSMEGRKARAGEMKLVTAALYEAKVNDEEIIRVLMIVCGSGREEAIRVFRNEKFISQPCRKLYQYLVLEKGIDEHDADVFIHNKARRALADNRDISKLSPDKMFEAINQAKLL